MWEDKIGTKRLFADGLTKSAKQTKKPLTEQQRSFLKQAKLIEPSTVTPTKACAVNESDEDSDGHNFSFPEESWSKPGTPRSIGKKGIYQKPLKKPISFNPVVDESEPARNRHRARKATKKLVKEDVKVSTRMEEEQDDLMEDYDQQMAAGTSSEKAAIPRHCYDQCRRSSNGFKNFKKSRYPEITRCTIISLEDREHKLTEMWETLEDDERSLYETGRMNDCPCKRKVDGAYWVECDVCDQWYHTNCAGIGDDIADKMAFFI